MLGNWKNFREIEDNMTLNELEKTVSAAREQETRRHRFMAALKGIDLDDEGQDTPATRVEEMKLRIASQQSGKTVEQIEFEDLGIDFEMEEE